MMDLSLEIILAIVSHLPIVANRRLRRTCSFFYVSLAVPVLTFKAYLASAGTFHDFKLSLDDLNDSSFLYLASMNHSSEVIRTLSSHHSHRISLAAKNKAVQIIIKGKFDSSMITALIHSGINLHLPIEYKTEKCMYTSSHLLLWATDMYHDSIVSLLLKMGVHPNTTAQFDLAAMHLAARNGSERLCRMLIDSGGIASASFHDVGGEVPMHYAAGEGHVNVVAYLALLGIDVRLDDMYGWTAIHFAADRRRVEVVKYLLEGGFVGHLERDGEGDSVLEIAKRNNDGDMILYLEDRWFY